MLNYLKLISHSAHLPTNMNHKSHQFFSPTIMQYLLWFFQLKKKAFLGPIKNLFYFLNIGENNWWGSGFILVDRYSEQDIIFDNSILFFNKKK